MFNDFVDIDDLSEIQVQAKIVLNGIRTLVVMKDVKLVGVGASELVIQGRCEHGTYYDALNPFMFCLMFRPGHKDYSITQGRLWTPSPTLTRIKS